MKSYRKELWFNLPARRGFVVTWTTNKKGELEMVTIITGQTACRAWPREYGRP